MMKPTLAMSLASLACAAACTLETDPLLPTGLAGQSCAPGYMVGVKANGELDCAYTIGGLTGGVVSGDSSFDRVGIGSAAPATALHIAGASGAFMRIEGGNSTAGVQVGRTSTAANQQVGELDFIDTGNLDGQRIVALINAVSAGTGQLKGADIAFRVKRPQDTGTLGEVMRITSDGRVGIGTSTPAAALDVRGRSRLGPDILAVNDNASADQRVWRQYVDSNSWYLATLPDSLATENLAIRVTRSGASVASINLLSPSVGIGTSTPHSQLEVGGGLIVTPSGNDISAFACDDTHRGELRVVGSFGNDHLYVCLMVSSVATWVLIK